jgi:putative ABC transport system permease protein
MILYDLRLAFLSMRRTPMLTALTAAAIACGIATCTFMMTIYGAESRNPILWKNDQLYAVLLDLKGTDRRPLNLHHFDDPPPQLAFRDAQALFRSSIPSRKVMSYASGQILEPIAPGAKPFGAMVRLTTADFFKMFDVPFLYGEGWNSAADEAPESLAVLSKRTNDRVFGGANSLGRSITLAGRSYRVIGVLNDWLPQPRFYDLGGMVPEDVYLPFRWAETLELPPIDITCLSIAAGNDLLSPKGTFTSDCVWIQFWTELPERAQRERFRQFIDAYVTDEKKHGRFPRPLNNRLLNVEDWLQFNDVVAPDTHLEMALAFMFLGICLLNTLGLMLAKFLGAAPMVGVRRALGASRRDILRQHLTEVLALGLLGGTLGLLLAKLGLAMETAQSLRLLGADNPEQVAALRNLLHMDVTVVVAALGLSLLTGLLAGLYPAWRIGRTPPAIYLKTQ